jgi:Cdc6-like AAA superfamily ATPase
MGDVQKSPSISKMKSKLLENAIINIDRTLSRLGDASFGPQENYGDDNDIQIQTNDKNASLVRTFAPPGLEESFQQLYSILYPCLCSKESSSGSAILMGPRGSGKSLLLERALQACQRFSPKDEVLNYRKVSINGIVIRGEDVPSVIFEIIRQLSDIALQESSRSFPSHPPSSHDRVPPGAETNSGDTAKSSTGHTTQETPATTNSVNDTTDHAVVLTKRRRMENYLLRLRQSSFTSNLSLLEATLKISEADRIPILLILDELDSFTDEGERQLLLYHLLDRVATPGSNLCLVGITSSFTAMSILEKRIRSRAEGSSKVIYVRPPSSYEALLQVLGHKLEGCHVQTHVLDLLTPPSVGGTHIATTTTTTGNESSSSQGSSQTTRTVNKDDTRSSSSIESRLIVRCMERQFRLGKDLRWFSRVLSCALSMYRYDVVVASGRAAVPNQDDSPLPPFQANHLFQSLLAMGSSLEDDGTYSELSSSSSNKMASDPRMQALLDLSTPQVTLLLCARRLLAKDAHREELVIPLTLQRILKEYESYRGGGKSNKKQRLWHWPAVWQLLERGVLVPASDHSGGGSLQYHAPISYKSMDPDTLSRLPLHLPIEVDHELGKALKENLLDCSTELSEWGRKTN